MSQFPADPDLDAPLTPAEQRACQQAAAQGAVPPLGLVRRFVLTIRKTFLASPKTVEKSKITRNKPAQKTPDQIDFF
jgi:hypothetical protein